MRSMIMSEGGRRVIRAVFGSLDGPSRSDLATMFAGSSTKEEITFDDVWNSLDKLLQAESIRYETEEKDTENE